MNEGAPSDSAPLAPTGAPVINNAAATIAPPAADRIIGPMPCVRCLYDLGGLAQDQKCPECGTETAATLGSIAAAPVAEHLRLRRGLLMIAIAMIGGVVWLMTGQFLVLFLAFVSVGSLGSSVPMMVIMAVVPVVSALLVVLSAVGWSRITGSIAAMQPERTRKASAVKRLAWAYAAFFLGCAAAFFVMQLSPLESGYAEVVALGACAATLLIWVVRTALGFGLLAGLARTLAAGKTVRMLRALVWGAIGLPVVIVGSTIGVELFNLESVAGMYLEYIVGGATFLLAVVIIALGVMAFVLRRQLTPFAAAARGRDALALKSAAVATVASPDSD